MSNYIEVKNLNNGIEWKKQISNEEMQRIKGYCYCKGREMIALIPATLKPVRTDTMENFAKDFFLPTTLNQAIRVQNIVGKVFAILASLVLDMITFPIRLLTCIPRVISNAKQEEHLLLKYLKKQNVDKKLLESNHVKVKFLWQTTDNLSFSQYIDEEGEVHRTYNKQQNWEELGVNFIELPAYPEYMELNRSGFHTERLKNIFFLN